MIARATRVVMALAALVVVAKCGDGSSDSATTTPPPVRETRLRRAASLIGYGPVNYWQDLDPVSFAGLLADNGLTLTGIEYVWGWQPNTENCQEKYGGGGGILTDPARARAFVDAMRAHGITTFINVVNWNSCGPRVQAEDWFADRLADIRDQVGSERVILQPVSEPWVSETDLDAVKAMVWTKLARTSWTGLFVLPGLNADSAVPRWALVGDFVDVHHCSDETLIDGLREGDRTVLHSTDCAPIVNPGPERAAAFTREALLAGSNLFIYGFSDETPDVPVIEAMGREIQRMSSVPAETPMPLQTPVPTATPSPEPTPSPQPTPTATPAPILPLSLP